LKIAYLINQYPKVSHSFIRREILALERQGFEIQRVALRGWKESLPDADDRDEQAKTSYVLREGAWGLVLPTLAVLLRSPLRLLSALRLALHMAGQSDHRAIYHVIYVAEACRILRWLNQSGAEHLHAHFGTNSAEVAMLTRVLGGPPYSFTVHGPDEFAKPMGLEEKVARADFVVAVSSFGRSQLYLRCRHADWRKVKVVHCGVEQSFYKSAASDVLSATRIVCVGRLCEAKGQLLLIEAVARLVSKQVPLDVVLAGDGATRQEIEALIDRFGLAAKVRITGWISSSEVRNEILAARALVLPSFAEGLPVVIMEAMALKRPVLSTYIAGIPELIRPGVDGWLFPAGAVDELELAIQDCLATTDEDLRRMGNAAQQRVKERHSIDLEATKLSGLFRGTSGPAT
jgi:colanic acid/amylovoran biosynthesis glycosyltransferase